MKIALTGATGFLGGHLWPRLLEKGHQLRALVRSPAARLERAGVETVQGDLTASADLSKLLEGREALIHLAGWVSRDPQDGPAMYRLHVEGTRSLLEAATRTGIERIVLASTSGTIGVSKSDQLATEADPYPLATVAGWPYYLSKIFEEKTALAIAEKAHLPLVCLNPSLLLGPGDAAFSSVGDIWKFLNRDIPAMPSGGLSFVDVRDAAAAFEAALTLGRAGERYLLGAANMRFDEFFGRLSRLSGVPPPRLRLPSSLNVWGTEALTRWARWRGTEPPIDRPSVEMGEHFFYIDSQKAKDELGFAPRDPQDTLRDTVSDLLATLHRSRPSARL